VKHIFGKSLFNIDEKSVKRYRKIKRNIKEEIVLSELIIRKNDPISFISSHHYSKTCPQGVRLGLGFYWRNVNLCPSLNQVGVYRDIEIATYSFGIFFRLPKYDVYIILNPILQVV
jgi:hypothetical protein